MKKVFLAMLMIFGMAAIAFAADTTPTQMTALTNSATATVAGVQKTLNTPLKLIFGLLPLGFGIAVPLMAIKHIKKKVEQDGGEDSYKIWLGGFIFLIIGAMVGLGINMFVAEFLFGNGAEGANLFQKFWKEAVGLSDATATVK